jgi:hypothetical protein
MTLNITSIVSQTFSGIVLAKTGSFSGSYKLTGDQSKLDAIIIEEGDGGWVTKDVPKSVNSFKFAVALSKDGTSMAGNATSPACAADVVLSRNSGKSPLNFSLNITFTK